MRRRRILHVSSAAASPLAIAQFEHAVGASPPPVSLSWLADEDLIIEAELLAERKAALAACASGGHVPAWVHDYGSRDAWVECARCGVPLADDHVSTHGGSQ